MTCQAQGSSGRLLLAWETNWGVAPSFTTAASTTNLPFASESLSATQAKIDNPHITGDRNYGKPVKDRSDCGGDINFMLNPLAHGEFWKSMLGAPVTTGSDPYTHTSKVPTVLPSASIEKGFTDNGDYFVYTGMVGATLNLTVKDSGFVDSSISYMGKGVTAAASTTAVSPLDSVDNPFELAAADIALTEGVSALATGTEVTLTIDNELDGDNYVIANEGQRGCITAGKCKVTGQLTAFFEDLTLYNKAVNSTESAIIITLRHGDGLGSAGNEKCIITIPELEYDQNDPVIGDSGGVNVVLPFRGYYVDNADATSLKVELFNALANYD